LLLVVGLASELLAASVQGYYRRDGLTGTVFAKPRQCPATPVLLPRDLAKGRQR
jgi:hypothetical protein